MSRKPSEVLEHVKAIARLQLGEEYTFKVAAGSSVRVINNIRVKLSQVRNQIKLHGKKPRQFKIRHMRTEQDPDNVIFEIVTLRKTETVSDLGAEFEELFLDLQVGGK